MKENKKEKRERERMTCVKKKRGPFDFFIYVKKCKKNIICMFISIMKNINWKTEMLWKK